MTARVFVDTNVLVNARDTTETEKQPWAELWLQALWKERRGGNRYQVLQKYYVTVTRKLEPGLPAQQARQDVQNLFVWNPVVTRSSHFYLAERRRS